MWGWFGGEGGRSNVFLTFYTIYNIYRKKQNSGNKKKSFLSKTIISHLMFSRVFFMLEILKSAPSLTVLVKWEVVSPNSSYREF